MSPPPPLVMSWKLLCGWVPEHSSCSQLWWGSQNSRRVVIGAWVEAKSSRGSVVGRILHPGNTPSQERQWATMWWNWPSHCLCGADEGKWREVKASDPGGQGGQGHRQVRTTPMICPGALKSPGACWVKEDIFIGWARRKGTIHKWCSYKPQVSGSLVPRPVFTKTTVLSIVPISKGLRDEKG